MRARKTLVFKESWAHKGGRGANIGFILPKGADTRKVEDVPKLHADFWRMVAAEIEGGFTMAFKEAA